MKRFLILLVAFIIIGCNEVEQPQVNSDEQLYLEMIARAQLEAYHQKAGHPGFPKITILEDCEGVACSPVHNQIELCNCRNTGERFYHVLVEVDSGIYFHTCFNMAGEMGQCPGGTY